MIGRIIGGVTAQENVWPWQAGLYIIRSDAITFCGGTLITPTKIVTSAYCVRGAVISIDVVLGEHNV